MSHDKIDETNSSPEPLRKPIGVTTLSDGRCIRAYSPSFGNIIDRIAQISNNPVTVATVPSLCTGISEVEIRELEFEDGLKLMEICAPIERVFIEYFKRIKNDASQNSNISQH